MAVNVATALPLARAEPAASFPASALRLRVLSAAALAPVALAAVWFGAPYLPGLIVLAAVAMAWEWARLCGKGRVGRAGAVIIAVTTASVVLAALGWPLPGLVLAGAGAFAVASIERSRSGALLTAFGVLWIGVPSIALAWLAESGGRATVLWIFAIVWATDIGAYAVGRTLGGPRLAPRLSPNKTWAGLVGGVACACLVGTAAALAEGHLVSPLPIVSAGLAVVAQAGDLAESLAKRHFGVKDSSGLIPGHGGVLDRLDGLLAVIPAVALINLLGGGSVLSWR